MSTLKLDLDLASIQEARRLVARAATAADVWAKADQAQVDRVCEAMARAGVREAVRLARLAREETGMGRYEDKVLKNRFGSEQVWQAYAPVRTRGILRVHHDARVKELAVPMGVVAAIIPSTNPTSTALYKAIISVKAGNAVVMSPHPRAARCVVETSRILEEAAASAGAPDDLIATLTEPTLEGTNELMRHRLTGVILATGGPALVRAAYSAGKPAYGVGPGNVPAVIERSAELEKAVADVVAGKAFDNGLLCSAENSIICDAPVAQEVLSLLPRNGAYLCDEDEKHRLEAVVAPGGRLNTAIAGQDATDIARLAGIDVPVGTRVLVAPLSGVGRVEEPLSIEKLSPVLGFYIEDGWRACCERAIQILNLGGIGHSMVIHSLDADVIDAFFREKPAFRILVNTSCAMGATGYTTGLAPAMTLGPGAWGGSITSDNITPLHLINIKRLAYELRSVTRDSPSAAPGLDDDAVRGLGADRAAAADLPGGRCLVPQVTRPAMEEASDEAPGAGGSADRSPGPDEIARIVRDFLADFRTGR